MHVYTGAFAARGVTAAQVLLTQEDLGDRDRALCVRTTLMRLLELGTVPILNENDSVSVREIPCAAQSKRCPQAGHRTCWPVLVHALNLKSLAAGTEERRVGSGA